MPQVKERCAATRAGVAAALIHGLNRVLPAAAHVSDVASAIATGNHDPSLFGAVVAHLARNFTGSVDAFRDACQIAGCREF
jgi:hypothetical protein